MNMAHITTWSHNIHINNSMHIAVHQATMSKKHFA